METPVPTTELSKTERRRLSKKRKKDNLFQKRKSNQERKQKQRKLTKAERCEKYTEKDRVKRESRKGANGVVCFKCRQRGHAAAQCESTSEGEVVEEDRICYRCGSSEHGLAKCKRRGDGLPFAKCFVCGDMGHLASQCEKNENGVFVNGGGGCRECESKFHVVANCPERRKKKAKKNNSDDESGVWDYNEDDGEGADVQTLPPKEINMKKEKKKVVNF